MKIASGKGGVWIAGVIPAVILAYQIVGGDLGANPVETLTHRSGDWALRFLLLSLAVTPVRRWTGKASLAPFRRTFGLLAFGYALLHVAVFAVFDHGLDPWAMWMDVQKRPYIAAGSVAFACLVPLAATSNVAAIRRLGSRWRTLHRLAYVAGVAAVFHYLWLVKADHAVPLRYGVILAILLLARGFPRRSALRKAQES